MRRPIDPESKAALASKQAARELDRALVESGVVTAREVNRDNSIAASVIDLYLSLIHI